MDEKTNNPFKKNYIYVMKEKKIEVNFLEIILIYNKYKREGEGGIK